MMDESNIEQVGGIQKSTYLAYFTRSVIKSGQLEMGNVICGGGRMLK